MYLIIILSGINQQVVEGHYQSIIQSLHLSLEGAICFCFVVYFMVDFRG